MISIVVMLILAGVSLNATVGDNGILSKAKNATYAQSRAMLEEFFQQLYVSKYEEFSENEDSKVSALQNLFPDYFFIPSNEGFGSLKYVVDSEGHALYLIKKSGLPDEIKKQLRGGDAGEGTYTDYAKLNDVYGITSDLQVYYSSADEDNIIGISKEMLDKDDPVRTVFSSSTNSGMYDLISDFDIDGDGNISAEEVKSISELTIDSSSPISSLKELYKLPSLKKLIISSKTLETLDGIETATNLYYVYFSNCMIGNYQALGKLGNKLQYLYLYNTTDQEIEKLCSADSGIAKYDLVNLKYFGIVGNNYYINTSAYMASYNSVTSGKSTNTITTTTPLANLSTATKNAVKYMLLNCNNITTLEGLADYNNLYLLRAEYNKLINLNGLQNKSALAYLFLTGNLLGSNELYDTTIAENGKNTSLDSLKDLAENLSLYVLRLDSNPDLKWVSYLEKCNNIKYLNFSSNDNIKDISSIKKIIAGCKLSNIPASYSLSIIDDSTTSLDLTNLTLDLATFESIGNLNNLYRLNLNGLKLKDSSGNIITDTNTLNNKYNEVLSKLKNMQYLKLYNLNALSTIDFVGKGKETKLVMLDLRNTSVTDLSNLNSYGTSIRTLTINNSNINMNNIDELLKRFYSSGWDCSEKDWNRGNGGGLQLCSKELWDKFVQNTVVTHVGTCNAYYTYSGNLDLSNMTSLQSVYLYNICTGALKLPESVSNFSMGNINFSKIVFPEITNFTRFSADQGLSGNEEKLFELLSKNTKECSLSLSPGGLEINWSKAKNYNWSNSKLTSISLYQWGSNNSYGMITGRDFSGLGAITSLKTLYMYDMEFKDVSSLGNLSNLTNLTLSWCNVQNISGLSNCTNLTSLDLNNNKITNLSELKTMKKLQTLNLTNNNIYDTSSYVDETGNTIVYNNLDIIAGLHSSKGGSLNTIYLNGNPGIIDYSPVSNLSWNSKNGF